MELYNLTTMLNHNCPSYYETTPYAVYPEPIPNKKDLLDTDVFPSFKYVNVDSLECLYIELEFQKQKRKFVLGSQKCHKSIIHFINIAISVGYFVFNTDFYM